VQQLPEGATDGDVARLFAEHGAVASVRLLVDAATGRPRDAAVVVLATREAAASAVASLNGVMHGGRRLKVGVRSVPQSAAAAAGGGGGGGGGQG